MYSDLLPAVSRPAFSTVASLPNTVRFMAILTSVCRMCALESVCSKRALNHIQTLITGYKREEVSTPSSLYCDTVTDYLFPNLKMPKVKMS